MRVAILVNSAEPTACHDYAVLWLDPAQHGWTRQTCVGIDLPAEGVIVEACDATLLTGADAPESVMLTLGNFRLDAREQLLSIAGTARWFSLTRRTAIEGRWHLRAIERAPDPPRRRRAAMRGQHEYS